VQGGEACSTEIEILSRRIRKTGTAVNGLREDVGVGPVRTGAGPESDAREKLQSRITRAGLSDKDQKKGRGGEKGGVTEPKIGGNRISRP